MPTRRLNRPLLALPLLLIAAACTGPQGQGTPAADDRPPVDLPESTVDMEIGDVIAEIDGMPVGANEFAAHAMRTRPRSAANLTEEERKEVLDELLDQKALYLEARRLGLDRDPKVQAQMVQLYLRRTVYNQVRSNDFTDEDLRAYFEEHRDEFIVPEKSRARRIFIKADPLRSPAEAKQKAQQAWTRIGGDIDAFNQVASEVSEGPYRGRGGDMGLITHKGRPGVPPEVVDMAFELGPGQISEPFEAAGGYNIVGVISKRESVERTFEQMKGAVLRRAKAERQRALYEETLKRLRDGAQVDIDEEAVGRIELRQKPRIDPLRSRLWSEEDRVRPKVRRLDDDDEDAALDGSEGDEESP